MVSVWGAEPKMCEAGCGEYCRTLRMRKEASMKTVDFYFDYSSTNSYFAAFLLPDLCRKRGATVNWFPVHSAALFRVTGFDVWQ
jgi:hypothetical protein